MSLKAQSIESQKLISTSDHVESFRLSVNRSAVETAGPLEMNLERRTVTRNDVRVPLGNRAYAVLNVLIARRGSLIPKNAI